MISLTLDGRTVEVPPGTNVLQAALTNGIHIPHLCHHPDLHPSGGCRLCLVEIGGRLRRAPISQKPPSLAGPNTRS